MQLSLDNKYATYYPPKYQLLKWIGNKQRFAVEITRQFPIEYRRYYEPFLGSGAILSTVAPHDGLGSDTFGPLMEIWTTLKKSPRTLVRWYKERRDKLETESKEDVYEQVRAAYNERPNGPDFLYLSRACYGGVVRFRKADGYMSTPCGAHTPIPVGSFARRVEEWSRRIKNVDFGVMDYKDAFADARNGDLVYCDPPYYDTQPILYGAQSFSLEELFQEIDRAKSRGVKVALSIDGHKKSGRNNVDLDIPKGLFKSGIYVNCGGSMLRRFQLGGKTVDGETVADRLLLTY